MSAVEEDSSPGTNAAPAATEPESGPERLKKEVRISLQTNAPPTIAGTPNAAPMPEKSFQWDFSWRGWDGLHIEVVERTPFKNPAALLAPAYSNAMPIIQIDRLKMSANVGARLEVDAAGFVTGGNLTGFDNGVQLRRALLTVAGDCILITPVSYMIELGYVPHTFNLNKAYLVFPNLGFLGNLKVGQFQPPMGLDVITSSRDITFMEPASVLQSLAPGVQAGFQLGRPVFQRTATWALGVFSSGEGSDEYGNASKNYGNAIGRMTWLAIDHLSPAEPSANQYLHLGMSANVQFSSSGTVRYRSRPESFLAPDVIDTGNIEANSAGTFGGEVAWVNGPFSVQGEFIDSAVRRDTAGALNFYGFYTEASWYLTGESRPYDRQTGAFKRLIPRRDFHWGKDGGWGAVEVACRYSYTDLTDDDVRGGRLSLLMGELNWYLQPHVRLMFNGGGGHVNGGASDGGMFIFQTRVGIDF